MLLVFWKKLQCWVLGHSWQRQIKPGNVVRRCCKRCFHVENIHYDLKH